LKKTIDVLKMCIILGDKKKILWIKIIRK